MNDHTHTYTHIETDAQFREFRARVAGRDVRAVAMDIEGEFNLHVYGERFCLLQLYDGHEQVVVDPVTVSAPLIRELLEDDALEKVTYDSASDRVLLAKTHAIAMSAIVDLKPAVELLEFPKQDLKSVIEATVGGDSGGSGSKKRYQQYNWTRRPIDPGAIEYALHDVIHLFTVRDVLFDRLRAAGLMDAYVVENRKRQERLPDVNRKPGLFRSGRHKRMSRVEQLEFDRLYTIRDRHARALDLPPNTVVANDDLFALAAGRITAEQITGNRRVPDATLRAIRKEMAG